MKKQQLSEELKRMQVLAGIITENQITEEEKLSPEEQKIVNDILGEADSINEGMFDIEKIKQYAKKGLLTAGIIGVLLSTPGISSAQQTQIKDIAKTEMSTPTTKEDVRGSLNQALKSTNPKVINSKDFMTDVPFTSWNYGANAGKANATVGMSIVVDKGADMIKIIIGQVPGKSTKGYETILTSAKNLGGKVYQSSKSSEISISKDKISDIASFVKANINNLTK